MVVACQRLGFTCAHRAAAAPPFLFAGGRGLLQLAVCLLCGQLYALQLCLQLRLCIHRCLPRQLQLCAQLGGGRLLSLQAALRLGERGRGRSADLQWDVQALLGWIPPCRLGGLWGGAADPQACARDGGVRFSYVLSVLSRARPRALKSGSRRGFVCWATG